MKRFITAVALTAALAGTGCASSFQQIQRQTYVADSIAYASLSAFQRIEEAQWHAKAAWPTADQHQQNGHDLAIAFATVREVAKQVDAWQAGQPLSENVRHQLTLLSATIVDLLDRVPMTAPNDVKAAAQGVADDTLDLVKKATQRLPQTPVKAGS